MLVACAGGDTGFLLTAQGAEQRRPTVIVKLRNATTGGSKTRSKVIRRHPVGLPHML